MLLNSRIFYNIDGFFFQRRVAARALGCVYFLPVMYVLLQLMICLDEGGGAFICRASPKYKSGSVLLSGVRM